MVIPLGLSGERRSNRRVAYFIAVGGQEMKQCTKCREVKPLSEFHRDRKKKDGLTPSCKICNCSRARGHHKTAPPSSEQRRKEKLKTRYKTSPEFIDSLYKEQEGCCRLCGEPLEGSYHIDHNHNTAAIRGLLHPMCNKGLGMFRDKPELLRKAAMYLEEKGHY